MKSFEKVWSLNNTTSYVERAFYYDYRGRLIQTVEKNTLGGISRTSIRYDYNDNITSHHESHQTSVGATADTKLTSFTYDNRGRLLSENTKVNSTTPQVSTTYTYNELGQPLTKTYGNGIVETMSYNIQGWLTNKVAKLSNVQQFNLDLRYYTKARSASTVRYNGNISEIEWQQGNTSSPDRYTYAYTYDMMNRLTNTTRYTGTSTTATNAYTEKGIGYDNNGNITALTRYGSSASTTINNLSYTYTGNRLTSLTDNGTTKTYSYDNNGNMTFDGRRGMNIQYNILNLPKSVEQVNGALTLAVGDYTYLADGTKVEAVNGSNAGYTYLGSLIYKRNGNTRTLEKAMFNDGVVLKSGSTYEPRYYTTDHLGSVRMITRANGIVDERSDYYPFGLEVQMSAYPKITGNYTKFSGKEDQSFMNSTLNYLDFGARMYDPVIARWSTTDPLSEKAPGWTPYRYAYNNPIRYIDPSGLLEADYFDEEGNHLGNDGIDDGQVRVINKSKWDESKTVKSDGSETIDSTTGQSNSTFHSESGISDDASLRIYEHYNFTLTPLTHLKNESKSSGMQTERRGKWFVIGIRIEGNNENKWSDNYNIIKNMFAHEERHVFDLALNVNHYLTKEQMEARAVKAQLNHSSYDKIGFSGKGPRTYKNTLNYYISKYITSYK